MAPMTNNLLEHKVHIIIVFTFFSLFSKDDIVVGAPFYFQRGVSGAIYVHINSASVIVMHIQINAHNHTYTHA